MKPHTTFFILLLSCFLTTSNNAFAQFTDGINGQERKGLIPTVMPFLRINPDGRTGALGEAGIAVSPDESAIYHNASKLAFVEKDMGFTLVHTPWLRHVVDGISLSYLSAYKRIDELQSVGLSFRYFSLGNIKFTDYVGTAGNFRPIELAIDLAYARKLSDKMSAGVSLKYAHSHLTKGQDIATGHLMRPAKTIAFDLSVYYENPDVAFLGKEATFSWGAVITNLGSKTTYNDGRPKDFIPTNLGVGTAIDVHLSPRNNLMFAFDINKLLVPTPAPANPQAHREKSMLSGLFSSFGDAPGGFSEELQELMFSLGVEYWYNNLIAVRLGHFNEHQLKGNRKYLTAGLGLKYKSIGGNIAYILPSKTLRYLDNTLRFQLNVGFGKK